jgi:hypothetical protein
MVRFEKDRYIVVIETNGNPIENWQNLQADIIRVLGVVGTEMLSDGIPFLAEFLQEIQPDWETAKKMTL